ncbi:acyltransferase family protein [Massilia antarctica]|uniref:acyltransferase family protein n=1 Tax=Massilia antarctica TaxID=2765360 RepID=UPI0006BB5EE5|nr:acyltransferase [Massilia sp. H27-R4]MCY0912004.1 acyltransferase [Massilia sp. H27-R4]
MSGPATPAGYVPALDGWRGMAIGLLLVGHFLPLPGINLGRVGVSLFFVLSGMLMARLLFIDKVAIGHFYRRRISRIIPAHLVFIMLTALAWLLLGLPIFLSEILAPLFFFNNYVLSGAVQFGHIWSLSVEEHSYIALSLVAIAVRAWRRTPLVILLVLAAACAAMIIWYQRVYPPGPELYAHMLHTETAAYGIVLSAFFCVMFHRRGVPRTNSVVVPLLIAGGVCLHWWSVPPAIAQVAGVAAFALAVNLLPRAAAPLQALFALRPLRQLGLWSFSLYLWQQPFYAACLKKALPLPLALAGAAALGIASYYLVEGPARRFLNARWTPARRG